MKSEEKRGFPTFKPQPWFTLYATEHPQFHSWGWSPSCMFNQAFLMWKASLSRRLSRETDSEVSRSRALLLWSGGTCPWCPRTQSQSGLLRHMNGTQISNPGEDGGKWSKPDTLPLIQFVKLCFYSSRSEVYIHSSAWISFTFRKNNYTCITTRIGCTS